MLKFLILILMQGHITVMSKPRISFKSKQISCYSHTLWN